MDIDKDEFVFVQDVRSFWTWQLRVTALNKVSVEVKQYNI